MGLRSESQRRMFCKMSPKDFGDLVRGGDFTSVRGQKKEKFQKPFPIDPEKYKQYMLSQDETGELAEQIENLKNRPNIRFDLDNI